ncbi:MAG TPA: RNA polymerase sigma factor [Caldimonas sp.]|nr:RNA polymerase sigma factor [Caldimonas sp.]
MRTAQPVRDDSGEDDHALAVRIVGGDAAAFEIVMRRHNGALFRTARAILRDDADAEDALQEAYLAAYRNLGTFRGDARLSTWLTRIVINQALGRLRARRRDNVVGLHDDLGEPAGEAGGDAMDETPAASPETGALRAQLRRLLEREIDALPLAFRTAFMLREVEEMTIDEVAASLEIPEATVRTRVFRARAMLRAALAEELDLATGEVFAFAGRRCDRIVAAVLGRLAAAGDDEPRV